MPTTLTETATFDTTVAVPASGEDRTAASVGASFQSLTNRTRALLSALSGHLVWSGHLYTAMPSVGIGVFLGGIQRVVIGASVFSLAAGTEVPGTLPLPATDTFFYLYAYDNAGTLGLNVSTDGPEATQTWKTGAEGTHRYLGCFRTDSSGDPLPFEAVGGHYRYRNAPASRRPLNAGTSTSGTAIDCSPYTPAHARMLHLGLTFVASGANGSAAVIRTSGEGGGDFLEIRDGQAYSKDSFITCDSSRSVQYSVSSASVNLTAYVHGWRERA